MSETEAFVPPALSLLAFLFATNFLKAILLMAAINFSERAVHSSLPVRPSIRVMPSL